MIDIEKLRFAHHTISRIEDLDDELTLNWKIVYDNDTDEIIYEDKLIALLSLGDTNKYNGPFIEQFEVLNTYKKMGYGTAIMQELLSEIDECYVLPESKIAVRFWEKLGFNKEDDGIGGDVWCFSKINGLK